MTERILSPQLLKLVQAAGPGYSQANPEWVKKFAMLIVKECAQIGEDVDGNQITKQEILKHFGVVKNDPNMG